MDLDVWNGLPKSSNTCVSIRTRPLGFGSPTNLESQAGPDWQRGIGRTFLRKVSSSLQAAMEFSTVSVTRKRGGRQAVMNLERVRSVLSPFAGLGEADGLAQNHLPGKAGI